jgi:hypothetical protein
MKRSALQDLLTANGYHGTILKGYLEAMLFTSSDDDGMHLDLNYDISSISEKRVESSLSEINLFCKLVAENNIDLGDYSPQYLGRDFWFTRNREGSGFGDGYYPENIGKILIMISRHFPEVNVFVGKDGEIE